MTISLAYFPDLVMYPDEESFALTEFPSQPPQESWPRTNPFSVEDEKYLYAAGCLTRVELHGNKATGQTYWYYRPSSLKSDKLDRDRANSSDFGQSYLRDELWVTVSNADLWSKVIHACARA